MCYVNKIYVTSCVISLMSTVCDIMCHVIKVHYLFSKTLTSRLVKGKENQFREVLLYSSDVEILYLNVESSLKESDRYQQNIKVISNLIWVSC